MNYNDNQLVSLKGNVKEYLSQHKASLSSSGKPKSHILVEIPLFKNIVLKQNDYLGTT